MRKKISFLIAFCVASTACFASNCNNETPGWGESLGTVTFETDSIWMIFGHGITQIWSDAVTATNCQKNVFHVGVNGNFNADCRSFSGFSGDLFTWCAVVRFQDELCPYPWRVPTMQDFVDLDIALGGDGQDREDTPEFVFENYIRRWGGAFGANPIPSRLIVEGSWGFWSLSEHSGAGTVYRFGFNTVGYVRPQGWSMIRYGFLLRCVR